MMRPTPAFAELLKRHRLAAGLTQDELAEQAQISVRAISDLERGVRRAPHKDTLRLLAEALDLSDDDRALLLESARQARRTAASVSTIRPFTSVGDFPVTLTPLIGREREEAAIAHLLLSDDVRLLTLSGPAGIGKARLATEAAVGLGAHVANSVFVSLTENGPESPRLSSGGGMARRRAGDAYPIRLPFPPPLCEKRSSSGGRCVHGASADAPPYGGAGQVPRTPT
jgi:transcriptional regulator with XRE-family HTH domain